MLCKSLKHSSRIFIKIFQAFAAAGLLLSVGTLNARASTVTAQPPYAVVTPALGGSATVFYAPAGIAGLNVDTGDNVVDPTTNAVSKFSQISVTERSDPASLVRFSINTTKAYVSITANKKSGGSTTPANVPIYEVGSATCSGQNPPCVTLINGATAGTPGADGYQFVPVPKLATGGTVEVGFFLGNLCAQDTSIAGCNVANAPDTTPGASPFTFNFNFTDTVPPAAVTFETPAPTISLQLETTPPTLNTCSPANLDALYFPGDERIFVDTSQLAGTSSQSGLSTVIVTGQNGAPPSATIDANPIHARIPIGGSREVTGFANTDGNGANTYQLSFALRDNAGAYSNFGCPLTHVRSSPISTFLTKSSCFIATAAFRSGEDTPVLMLRQFRDQILLHHSLGRSFVKWYYSWSPPAAEWLMEHSEFRYPVLTALVPVQLFGWLALHVGVASLLLLATLLFWTAFMLPSRFLKKTVVTLFLLSLVPAGQTSFAQEPSNSPYLDSIQKKLQDEDAKKADASKALPESTAENPDPYIQKLREKIPPAPPESQETYTEALQRKLNAKPAETESFIEKEQPKITKVPGEGSAIDDFQSGKKLEPKFAPLTNQAVGIQFGFSGDHNATSSTSNAPYKTVYGPGFTPDLKFFYEFKPFDREWIGSLGVILNFGIAFKSGTGPFKFPLTTESNIPFDSLSQTKLQFFTLPVTAGLIYRANLSRYIKPYAELGPAIIGYLETRNDNGPSHYGESRGYYGEVGVNFLLDWISRESTWELYEANGIKHYYLTVNYSRLSSFSGAVTITNSGANAGLTFEL